MHDSQPLMPLLRQALDKAEPYALIYAQHPHGALTFLQMLDDIKTLADACTAQRLNIESELVRLDALVRRAKRDAEVFVKALGNDSIPTTSTYGAELMALAAQRKRQRTWRLARVGMVLASFLGLLAYAVITTPPTADTTSILNMAVAGETTEAYALAQQEAQAFPDDLETHVWLAVLAEQVGDTAVAAQTWQHVETLDVDAEQLLYMRGNVRLLAGNLDAAQRDVEALREIPSKAAEALFLEAGIVEAQGDVDGAIALFRQASDQAERDGRQEMAVLARVRMGNLMQYGIRPTATPRSAPAP